MTDLNGRIRKFELILCFKERTGYGNLFDTQFPL